MIKTTDADKDPLVKPQTPLPPFPYSQDEVDFANADRSRFYSGTITSPHGLKKFPAVMLISGSGTQDRDGTIGLHKPMAVIADYLSRKGFVVFRIDDHKSLNSEMTTFERKDDLKEAISVLKKHPLVDSTQIGLLGHCEGGIIASMIASEVKTLSFIILLASPGRPIVQLMADQSEAALLSLGIDSAASSSYKKFYTKILETVLIYQGSEEVTYQQCLKHLIIGKKRAFFRQSKQQQV